MADTGQRTGAASPMLRSSEAQPEEYETSLVIAGRLHLLTPNECMKEESNARDKPVIAQRTP